MIRMRALVLMTLLAACGPVAYVGQVTLRADDAVARAREADADKYSPYWWTRATQYLHMAREVGAHADYQGATHFGRLAEEAANKAREEAEAAAKDPSKRPPPPDGLAPAKDGVAPAKDAP
jgi:hypothetical protein